MRLRQSVTLGLVLLPFSVLFASLGFWQLQRMHDKQELMDRFAHAAELELSQAIAVGDVFTHVHVNGHYNQDWHLLLDNKILNGQVGVYAMSLFKPDKGRPILVNRGWLPLPADRSSLPEIPTPSGNMNISGILAKPVEGGIQLGEPDKLKGLSGPRLITYLDLTQLGKVLGGDLSPWIIQLDARDKTGFDGRDWKPAVMLPAQHRAYAIQWFALALSLIIIWLAMSWKWAGSVKFRSVGSVDDFSGGKS